ncbi:asparaginase [Roseateles koreensis]|uniref:Asparaginase n=1 Tax=Roseateles koreensis TaxID=2987526 RepID=A0ABT5KTN2_9BURK|nr:asparaginase [Roseateles koreensis]MDC8786207.1 asparaginase [Roseateles koreensis]
MQNSAEKMRPADLVVILGTGGTIAGRAAKATDNVGYQAGELGVAQLVAAVPGLEAHRLEMHQLAQLDSKDMDFETLQRLAQQVSFHLARNEVCGVVITHGTDTAEETAYFLQRVLAPSKSVVLTAAMRPATALQADGPQNLLDAVVLAQWPTARGVVLLAAGQVHAADQVQKVHSYRIDAFKSRDAALCAVVEEGHVRELGVWPRGDALGLTRIASPSAAWPLVHIVMNHVGADGRIVDALLAQGCQGLVVAGTGNGTLSQGLEHALLRACAQGVRVLRASRCDAGPVIGGNVDQLPSAGALSPVKARIELLLQLLA